MKKPRSHRKHGGARAGSGRKRSALPQDVLDEIGKPPIGRPLELARWYCNAIGLMTIGVLEGKPWKKLLESMRASAIAAGRVLSSEILFAAAERVRERDGVDVD